MNSNDGVAWRDAYGADLAELAGSRSRPADSEEVVAIAGKEFQVPVVADHESLV
jgi:hypothetical protein